MDELTGRLQAKTQAYRWAEKDAAEKRHAADMSEARAYLMASGPVEERKRIAATAVELEEGKALVAEALVRVLRAERHDLETMIDSCRSYGTNLRAELKTFDYGQAP